MTGCIPVHAAISAVVGGYIVFVRMFNPETGAEAAEPHSFGTLDNALDFARRVIEEVEETNQTGDRGQPTG